MTALVEKLRNAQALIEEGWCQGFFRKGNSYCALGAIFEAQPYGVYTEEEAKKLLCRVTRAPYISGWNDALHRTQKDVITAFSKAIDLALQEGK